MSDDLSGDMLAPSWPNLVGNKEMKFKEICNLMYEHLFLLLENVLTKSKCESIKYSNNFKIQASKLLGIILKLTFLVSILNVRELNVLVL